MRTPISKQGWSSRSIEELEYSLTLRTLDTNAATIVAISRYQYVRLLPARIVSTYAAPTMFCQLLIMFLPRFQHVLFALSFVPSFLKVGSNLNSFSCSFLYFFLLFSILFSILFSFVVSSGPGQVMFSYLFSTAYRTTGFVFISMLLLVQDMVSYVSPTNREIAIFQILGTQRAVF